jgi:hypothetical protein
LHLRCKYLIDFNTSPSIYYQPLIDIYNKNQFEISSEDKRHITGIMNKWDNSKLSYENLMACYQAKRILNILIKQKSSNIKAISVANDLYKYLIEHCFLTEKQVGYFNKYIANKKTLNINGKWFYRPYTDLIIS